MQISNSEQTTMIEADLPKVSPPEESASMSKVVALQPGNDFRGVWYTRDNSVVTVEDIHNNQFTGRLENTGEDHLWDRQGNSLIASAYDLMERISGKVRR